MANKSLSRRRPRRSLLSSDEEEESEDLFGIAPPAEKVAKFQKPHMVKSQTIEGLRRDCKLISTLTAAGLILDETRDLESKHSLTLCQALFKKKVESGLRSDPLYPSNLNKFSEELFQYLEADQAVLVKALLPLKPCPDSSHDTESLLRVLLNIECLQPTLSSWLLEKLALVSLENDKDPVGEKIPKLILNNLRWLNVVTNGEALADKLLEILDATPELVQAEIIASLPEIIPDSFHTKVALALEDKMTTLNLTPVILDTFTNLTLKSEALMKLRKCVMKSLPSASNEDLPIMVKFLISCVDSAKEAIGEIDDLRDNLNLDKNDTTIGVLSQFINSQRPPAQKAKKHDKDFDVLVMDVIRVAITSESKIGDGWIRAIDNAEDFKSLDLLVLLLLFNLPNKKRAVESLVKNKIRAGQLTEDHVKRCFKNHPIIIKAQFESVQALAEMLMVSTERSLNLMSNIIFVQAFVSLDRFCQQEVIADLVAQIGSNQQTRDIGLTTLASLAKEHCDKLSHYALFVAGVLDNVHSMSLSQVRLIMDILSRLAYTAPNAGHVLRDDLHMIIRKQISSSGKNLSLKQMGVIGAVATVKNMCKVGNDNQENVSNAGETSRLSTSGSLVSQALQMLEMVKTATKNVNSVAGLFMDELACIFQSNDDDLEKDLVNWISERMAFDFEKDFTVDASKEDMDGRIIEDAFLPLQLAYGIDDPELEDHIAVVLGQIVFKGTTLATRLIPHFRLLSKCIFKQQKGDLQDINAVLGSPIWMPKNDIYAKLDSLSHQELNSLCEILFYCYNWFRELINTFAIGDEEDKNRVLIRLKNMIQLQSLMRKALALNPNYVPPQMLHLEDVSGWTPPNFAKEDINGGKGKGKGKRSAKRKAGQDTTNLPSTANSQNTSVVLDNDTAIEHHHPEGAIDLDAYSPFYRELDLDVFNILTFKVLTIGSEPVEAEEFKDPKLRPPEFLLLLKDLNTKLSHVLVASKSKKGFPGKSRAKEVGFTNLDQLGPLRVIQRILPIMDKVLAGLEEIAEYFLRLIEVNDGVMDAIGLYTDDLAPILIACLEHAFGSLKAILCWNGFQDQDQLVVMKRALALFGNRLGKIDEKESLKKLTESALKYLNRFHKIMVNAACASNHLKLLEALDSMYPECGTETLHKTSGAYLNRQWVMLDGKTAEKGTKFNANIEYILTVNLKTAKEVLPIIENYVEKGLLELVNKAQLESYPTLNMNTLAVHYRVLLNFLVSETKKTTYGVSKNHEAQLEVWDTCTRILKLLLDVIKPLSHPRSLIGPLLKGSRPFLEHFLKHCMPLMDRLFSQKREDCTALLKTMQASTRFLQHVCSHSKINKDVALSNHVPQLKKALETFVFRVKAMLALNNAVGAFWLGNLKNRDLKGEEIMSQMSIMDEGEDDPEEESMGANDDKSDVELDNPGEDDLETVASTLDESSLEY